MQSRKYYSSQAILVFSLDVSEGLTTGSKQGGIADAVMQAVAASPEELRSLLLANIVVVGGNCKLPGFIERLLETPIFKALIMQSEGSQVDGSCK